MYDGHNIYLTFRFWISFRYAREAVDHIEQYLLSNDEMLTKYCAANFFVLYKLIFFLDAKLQIYIKDNTFSAYLHDQVQFLNRLREYIDE